MRFGYPLERRLVVGALLVWMLFGEQVLAGTGPGEKDKSRPTGTFVDRDYTPAESRARYLQEKAALKKFNAEMLKKGIQAAAQADQDVGDIAVLFDNGSLTQPAGTFPFNLDNARLHFSPNGNGHNVSTGTAAFGTDFGTNLTNELKEPSGALNKDDGQALATIPFAFPFFGSTYDTLYISANGILAFGKKLNTTFYDVNLFLGQIPTLAMFYADLNPGDANSDGVYIRTTSDSAIITWNEIVEYGATAVSTAQLILTSSGDFEIIFESVALTVQANGSSIFVGTNPGGSNPDLTQVDFTNLPITNNTGGVYQAFFVRSVPVVNELAVILRFYSSHPDNYEFFVYWTNFTSDLGNALAYHFGVYNDDSGFGRGRYDGRSSYGVTRLQSIVNNNRPGVYGDDPHARTFSDGNSYLGIMAQETGHRWLAFPEMIVGLEDPTLMLGRTNAHWSYFFHTENSSEGGGNWILSTGNESIGTYTNKANSYVNGYNTLDEYLMGLRDSNEVYPAFIISSTANNVQDASGYRGGKGDNASPGQTATGRKIKVNIENIVAREGLRYPSRANSQKVFRQAYIYVVEQGKTVSSPDVVAGVAKWQLFADEWQNYYSFWTEGRGIQNVDLNNEYEWGTVEGTVSYNSQPVNEITVELVEKGWVQKVPKGGYYAFRILETNLGQGDSTYTIVVHSPGFESDTSQVTISFDDNLGSETPTVHNRSLVLDNDFVRAGFAQNPVFGKELDIYAIGRTPLANGTVSGSVTSSSGSEPLTFSVTGNPTVYVDNTYTLPGPTTLTIRVQAQGEGSAVVSRDTLIVSVATVTKHGAGLTSVDGDFKAIIAEGALSSEVMATIVQGLNMNIEAPSLSVAHSKAYTVGPALDLDKPMLVSIPVSGVLPSDAAIAILKDGEWFRLPTRVDAVTGALKAESMEAGSFQIRSRVEKSAGQSAAVPSEFALEQNYPNPFNPSTTIKFDLKGTSSVSLRVYNMLGQEVRTLLASEQKGPGSYRIEWDGRDNNGANVSTGVYIYRIVTDGFTASRKMLLLK